MPPASSNAMGPGYTTNAGANTALISSFASNFIQGAGESFVKENVLLRRRERRESLIFFLFVFCVLRVDGCCGRSSRPFQESFALLFPCEHEICGKQTAHCALSLFQQGQNKLNFCQGTNNHPCARPCRVGIDDGPRHRSTCCLATTSTHPTCTSQVR